MNWVCKLLFICLICAGSTIYAQSQPNIGFENGTFSNWECKYGTIDPYGVITYGGVATGDRFVVYSKATNNNELDPYGDFPVVCPNGSNYSVRLGNSNVGAEAESLNYTLMVPNTPTYSLVFNYAVVLQNPSHASFEQPKFTAQIYNVTDGTYINCPSFNFVAGSALPGFQVSKRVASTAGAPVSIFYKDWSTATINLNGCQGKTIRIEFATNDCTKGQPPRGGGHFGYAYLDISEGVLGAPITGNAYCATQTSVTLKGPVGFADYYWYNADFSKLIGHGKDVKISPAPPDLTKYALQVLPYPDLGCVDTLYTVVNKIDEGFKLKVTDTLHICRGTTVNLTLPSVTAGSSDNMTYSYFTDSLEMNYLYNPLSASAGTYYIKGINNEGCMNTLPVHVVIDDVLVSVTDPAPVNFPGTADISKAYTRVRDVSYSYYSNAACTIPVNYIIGESGRYYIKGENKTGCTNTAPVNVVINPPPPYIVWGPTVFTPNSDGINDDFMLKLTGYVSLKDLKIFNRYGQQVFQAKSVSEYWDGTFKGKQLPVGTYYWLFEGTDDYYHTRALKNGSITIIR